MALNTNLSNTKRKEDQVFGECLRHSQTGFNETEKRATGKQRIGSISFDEADELFRSWIDEGNWPYDALLFDPRIFTFIFEKAARLIANKPRGRLIPREGSDVLAAKINNLLLDYQWDQATNGGSMIAKYAMMDMNTRKYGAAFALCKWRYETDDKGRVLFDGPDMQVLNNRDLAHDLTATSIENANWFQVRQYVTFQELENVNDFARSKPIYKNLSELREAIGRLGPEGDISYESGRGDTRGTNWISRNRAISHLETDPVGKDEVFKTVEIVTEYRRSRWITFAPKHGVVLRDIENPYQNNEIPITMLRYYAIDDDLYGLSEIEPVKGLQKAINALLCQYVDEINQNLYSPIAIGPGVRQHTLEWGKGARWIMNNPQTDFRIVEGKSNAAAYFNNTYSVLVSAMMNALGETSLGVSNIQPFQNDKTATEVKALQLQRNARDNFNQISLTDCIKRQMMLWHSMNQLLLFSDPKKQNYILRIAGKDAIDYFKTRGLDQLIAPDPQLLEKSEDLKKELGEDTNLTKTLDEATADTPRFPVQGKSGMVPKLVMDEDGQGALLYVEPADLRGDFDFSVDVETMGVNADDQKREGRQVAVQALTTNPNLLMLLAQEHVKPKFKDLFVSWLEDLGFVDADKFFEQIQDNATTPQGNPMQAAAMPPMPQLGPASAPPSPGNDILNSKTQQQPAVDQNLGEPNPAVLNNLINQVSGGQNG